MDARPVVACGDVPIHIWPTESPPIVGKKTVTLFVKRISTQPDELEKEIDTCDFNVKQFKRAIVDCEVEVDGEPGAVKLIVDLRGCFVEIVSKHPAMTEGALGMGLMFLYEAHAHETILERLTEPPNGMTERGSFPIGDRPELFLGYLHQVQKRKGVRLPTAD